MKYIFLTIIHIHRCSKIIIHLAFNNMNTTLNATTKRKETDKLKIFRNLKKRIKMPHLGKIASKFNKETLFLE